MKNIARLYEDACNAKNETIKANQAEILCWCNFIIGLDKSVDEIMVKEKLGMKKAKGLIYDFILAHNPDTKRVTLYQSIRRARKIYRLIEKIGIDKIKYIKTYSANSIAELSVSQIQIIIDYFSKNPDTELSNNQDSSIPKENYWLNPRRRQTWSKYFNCFQFKPFPKKIIMEHCLYYVIALCSSNVINTKGKSHQ